MKKVKTILSEILRLPETQFEKNLTMAETESWDSLAHMEIISAIETEFAVVLETDDIVEMVSVEAIITTLRKHNVAET